MPVEYVTSDDFANADILLCSLTGIINNDRWFAISYVYKVDDNLWIKALEKAFTNRNLFKWYSALFGDMTEEDLKKAIIKDHDRKNNGWFRYNNCNRQIPILFEYNFDEK